MHHLLIDEWLSEQHAKKTPTNQHISQDEETMQDRTNYQEWSQREEANMLYKCNWKQLPLFSRLELTAQYISDHTNTSSENARIIVKQIGFPDKVSYIRKEARIKDLELTMYSCHELYLEQNDTL